MDMVKDNTTMKDDEKKKKKQDFRNQIEESVKKWASLSS
jgi:hypothetical protein